MTLNKQLLLVCMVATSATVQANYTVHFYAWRVRSGINKYFQWFRDQVDACYGIDFNRLRVNEENFASMEVSQC